MYRAKADGRGVYRFFETEMGRQAEMRRSLELDLRTAVANGDFQLYYQPIVDLKAAKSHRRRSADALEPFRPCGSCRRSNSSRLRKKRASLSRWANGRCAAPALTPRDGPTIFASRSTCRRCSFATMSCREVANALRPPVCAPDRLELEITESAIFGTNAQNVAILKNCANSAFAFRWTISAPAIPASAYFRAIPVRQGQDRPVLRSRNEQSTRKHGDHSRGDRARREPRHLRRPQKASKASSSWRVCGARDATRCKASSSAFRNPTATLSARSTNGVSAETVRFNRDAGPIGIGAT